MGQLLKLSTRKLVKKLLTISDVARDSDRYILCCIWHEECKKLNIESVQDFFTAYNNGKLTNSESVRRIRQKLQETQPELRGKKYRERHDVLEPKVKEELRTFEDED